MKKIILTLLIGIITSTAKADFQIIFLNTPTITINGIKHHLGDTFKSKEYNIDWQSSRQAMKIKDTTNGKQYLVVAEDYTTSKVKSIIDYISQTKHLSSRDGAPDNVLTLANLLNDRFYFTDSLTIATGFPTDKDRFFYISYRYNGQDINKLVTNHDGTFTISSDIFTIDGYPIPPFETTIAVYYLDQIAGTVMLITDSMWISLIPAELP